MGFVGGSKGPVQVFIVDADPVQRRIAASHAGSLEGLAGPAQGVASGDEALGAVSEGARAVVLADLETLGGIEALAAFKSQPIRVIATSARGSINTAVAAIKAGAVDYLPKPYGAAALLERLTAAIAQWDQATAAAAPAPAPAAAPFEGFVGQSAAMRAVFEQIERIAPSRAPVFITGESGTGKELCAEALHARSGRGGKPFVAINCGAIPKDLMESEIFGHVRGAFTGATETRAGAAELADGGTLFLDEIGEMDLGLQAKLLRFLQSGTVQRVGDATVRRVDVRIVSATNRDPFTEIAAGRFREDLFYRLHVLPIHMPPLRERGDDVLLLASAFLDRYAAEEGRDFRGFAPDAAACLAGHGWPGNVRELQNAIRRTVVLNQGGEVTAAMLPATLRAGDAFSSPDARIEPRPEDSAPPRTGSGGIMPFWEQERSIIESAVGAFAGNIARAAAALEISPSTIYRKRQAWQERRTS